MTLTNRNLIITAGGLLTVLSVLIAIFAYQHNWFGLNLSPEEKVIRDLRNANNDKNPLLNDLAEQKFNITYTVDDVRGALPSLEVCSAYIDSDLKLKQAMRANAAIEVLTLADESTVGVLEKRVQSVFGGNATSITETITPYADYFTGSFLYFIQPTTMTRSTANDLIQKYSSSEPMKYLEKELKHSNNPNKQAVLYICTLLDVYLGALGVDTISKTVSKELVTLTSRTNVSNYLDLLEQR